MSIDRRLSDLGLELPKPAAPVAAYVPSVMTGGLLHISGQLPFREDGSLIVGRLGETIDIAGGMEAARRCGLMLLAQIGAALDGDFGRIERIVKLGVFVSSTPQFTDQPKVANGASELMVAALGDIGRHARSAVGVAVLPLGAPVEVDAIVAISAA
jgi:enamine deaminase RidA (YjgF/YER057c/UK114 family)